ncbi:MAG: N-acetylmuramoyl-L-alanine amidase [Candidatus Omnitrophica bacterium]|nr:N-acetylmuramoyl-L-alanine amidase [Candidatus Omnitrophota bacterium]
MKRRTSVFLLLVSMMFVLSGCGGVRTNVISSQYPNIDVLKMNGSKYFMLSQFKDQYGATVETDNVTGIVTVNNGQQIIKLLPSSNKILINGQIDKLEKITIENNGYIYVPMEFLSKIRTERQKIKIPEYEKIEKFVEKRKTAIQTIVIDPGHGGKDYGARGYGGLKEKDVVLDIAKRVERELKDKGIKNVILTRNRDHFISLQRRAEIANTQKADLFVSIHANAAKARDANGFEVFYLSPAKDDVARAIEASENEVIFFENSEYSVKPEYLNTTLWNMTLAENKEESKQLAGYMSKMIPGRMGLKNRGVKSANFYVLRGTRMPAVLVEVGFISNKAEEKKLASAAYRQNMADSIVDSIMGYDREFTRTHGFTENL